MKIKELKINNYGKLKEKDISLDEHINIIYGKNESGKSTLLHFILNTFYGASKNKKGREYSDFEKYKPWIGEEFSGKITYKLDNQEQFEVFRDFKKKNPKIFNEQMEEISNQFNINKTNGNEFFYEQTKMEESLFVSTFLVNQQEVRLEKQDQNVLVQKIANMIGTGEDNVSYKKAMDRINKRQLEEIGNQRTREKPINLIEKEIQNLEENKKKLQFFKDRRNDAREKGKIREEEIKELENQYEYCKEMRKLEEKNNLEKEKISVKEKIKSENLEKIEQLKQEIQKEKEEKIAKGKISGEKLSNGKDNFKRNGIISFIAIILLNIISFLFIQIEQIKYAVLFTIPIFFITFMIISKSKKKKIEENKYKEKQEEEMLNNKINQIENEIRIYEDSNLEIEKEIKDFNNTLDKEIDKEEEIIKNRYLKVLSIDTFNYIDSIENQLEKIEKQLHDKKVEYNTLEIEGKRIEEELEKISNIEEKLSLQYEKKEELEELNDCMEFAKRVLSSSYEKMKSSVAPKFTEELSRTISKITNGKYQRVKWNDEEGVIVELENGSYIPISRLSVGTIDQLYLSLRLSMSEQLSRENMPIILDEAFAYYDTERLINILKYIEEEFKNHQVILFTCTNREKEIFNQEGMKYHFVEL